MTSTVLLWLSALTLALWLAVLLDSALGARRIGSLRDAEPVADAGAPRVSVVVAARNEARAIEHALASVLAQRYPDLEVIVVDDRSTDATGAILDRISIGHPRLHVAHLDALPPGWLGKNHAMQRGAAAATGDWILFTDADVVMETRAIARAVGFAEREGLDHLTVTPRLLMPGPALDLFAGTFGLLFAQYSRPWKARDPRSRAHIGIGAFNLVRASAYRAAGGHAPIAMRPDDDLKLGKLLKQNGFRQDLLFGRDAVSVEWYSTIGEAVRGLEKNSFAGAGYSVPAVLASSLALLALDVWPFLAVLVTAGPTRWLYLASVAVILAIYAGSTRGSGTRPWLAPLFPLGVLLLVYILLRSTWLAVRNGGIRWRDTFYPLEELRRNRV